MTEVAYRLCRVSEPHGLDLLGLLFSHCLLEVSERRLPSGVIKVLALKTNTVNRQ